MTEQGGPARDDTPHTDRTAGSSKGTDDMDMRTGSTAQETAHPVVTGFEDPAPARRRGPDPLALLVGLATLAMAVFAFVGELPDLPDPRWLLAGGAALVGLVLLVGSLRGRRGPRS